MVTPKVRYVCTRGGAETPKDREKTLSKKFYHGTSTDLNILQDRGHGVVDLGLHGHAIGHDNATKTQNMSEGLDTVAASAIDDNIDGITTSESLEIGSPFF